MLSLVGNRSNVVDGNVSERDLKLGVIERHQRYGRIVARVGGWAGRAGAHEAYPAIDKIKPWRGFVQGDRCHELYIYSVVLARRPWKPTGERFHHIFE